MHILFLTPDLSEYGSAFYQWDVYNELCDQHTVETYGPGFESYSPRHDIEDILEQAKMTPDVICLGHGWLWDPPGEPVARENDLTFDKCDVPAVLILNKEYLKLEQKITYARERNIDLVFTHHHGAEQWTEEYGIPFVFWPFAVNDERFKDYGEPNRYDFTFSGVLRNDNPDVEQTDLRKRVQSHLFYTIGQVWLAPKWRYRDLDFFWSVQATHRIPHLVNRIVHRQRRLPDDDYKKLLNRSKMVLNTHSPVDLVGTRYYETMASKSLPFCQESSIYEEYDLFVPGEHCVTFADDFSDFDEKLFYYLEENIEREKITTRAHDHVMEYHTWERRIEEFTTEVSQRLL